MSEVLRWSRDNNRLVSETARVVNTVVNYNHGFTVIGEFARFVQCNKYSREFTTDRIRVGFLYYIQCHI